jgi:hypothetical protein
MLALGEIFTLVVYGQLILENAVIYDLGVMLSTRSSTSWSAISHGFALQLYSKRGNPRPGRSAAEDDPEAGCRSGKFNRFWQRPGPGC